MVGDAAPLDTLADFLAPIVNAKTARFKCTVQSDVPNGNAAAIGYFRASAQIRQEFTEPEQMVSIADFERGRMLSLMPNKKEAMIFELKGKMSEDKIRKSNFFGNLRHAGRLSPGGSKGTARRTGRERTRRATRLRFSHRVDRPGANVVGGRRHGPAGARLIDADGTAQDRSRDVRLRIRQALGPVTVLGRTAR